MNDKKRKKLKSWLIVYALMCAAVVFTAQSLAIPATGQRDLSPVTLEGEEPILNVETIVRRTDL